MDVVTSNKTLGQTEILYIHDYNTNYAYVFTKEHGNSKTK